MMNNFILIIASFLKLCFANIEEPTQFSTLSNLYTLTTFIPGNSVFDNLLINNLNVFQSRVFQYCPWLHVGNPQLQCPNGTQMIWSGTLWPSVTVPGGQQFYVAENGKFSITVQHSSYIPPGSYPSYQGWTWKPLPTIQLSVNECDPANEFYNCTSPTGIFTFKAPDTNIRGGVFVCQTSQGSWSLWAKTPKFNQVGCIELLGLGTHPYSGINPPVWAYYGG